MRWRRFFRLSSVLGASICGSCVARTFVRSGLFSGFCPGDEPEEEPTEEVVVCEPPVPPNLTLKQVHVFFRHGARLPLNKTHGIDEVTYPMDICLHTFPYTIYNHNVVVLPDMTPKPAISDFEIHYQKTPFKGGGYAGNLSCWGQYQVFDLGKRLRENYMHTIQFLPLEYSADDVHIQSTDIARSIASARCILAGLYGKDTLNKNGPVIIPVSLPDDEILFPNSKVCGVLKKMNHHCMIHPDNVPGNKEDRDVVEKALGYDPAHPEAIVNFVALRDDLMARYWHGFNLPEEVLPYMDLIEHNACKIMYYAMAGQFEEERPYVARLATGPALHKVMTEMDKMMKGEESKKIYLYSSHDSLLVALLEAMSVFDWRWPPFAADITFELYQNEDDKQFWIRTLYCGKEVKSRGCCQSYCPFEEFEKGIRHYVLPRENEYWKICKSDILEALAHKRKYAEKPVEEDEEEDDEFLQDIPAGMQ